MAFDEEVYNMTIEYWRSDECKKFRHSTRNSVGHYFGGTDIYDDTDLKVNSRSRHLVKIIKELFDENEKISVHEFGCNVGRNLYFVRRNFCNSIVSGNDVNEEAIEFGTEKHSFKEPKEKLFIADTFQTILDLYNQSRKFDLLFTMAHFMHIPNDVMNEISKFLPKICKFLICYESGINKKKEYESSLIFKHDYVKMFGNCIKEQDNPLKSFNKLFVWRFYDV